MNNAIKKLFFVSGLIVAIGLFLFHGRQIFSYDTKVAHPFLIEKSIALYEQSANITFTDQEKDWIRHGAVDEDMPIRWMNHFLDPNTGKGLPGFSPANVWAKSDLAQVAYTMGDQTWSTAIAEYNNGDKKNAFIALGHILHLIEDMAVPAHARNDSHAGGDLYEEWVENNINAKYGKTELVKFDNLDSYVNSLSDYSNKYFLSKDTIVKNDNLATLKRFNKLFNGNIYTCILGSLDQCLLLVKKDVSGDVYYFDNPVHSDYYFLLAPKAISYGAGVIDLFFKQVEFEKDKKPAITFTIKQNIAKAGGIIADRIFNFFTSYQSTVYNYETKLINTVSSDTKSSASAPLQITTQNKPEGRVLAASESVSAADKPAVQEEQTNITKIPPTPPTAGGLKAVETKPAKPAPVIKQNPVIAIPVKSIAEPEIQTQIPLTPPTAGGLKGGEAEPQIPTIMPAKGSEIVETIIPQASVSVANTAIHRKGSDSIPPETSILSAPNAVSSSTSAVFVFSSNEADSSFECDLDNAGWQECLPAQAGGATNLSNLSDGSHNLKVIAEDSSNNADQTPAEYSWIIDTAAPTSSVSALLAEYQTTGFQVNWIGTDGLASTTSGLSDFDIQYKIDSGQWQDWIMAKTTTQTVFDIPVDNGSSVYFRSRSSDFAGNLENWPDNPDANTIIAESEEIPEISESLVHLWHFDECEGDSINDSVGDDDMPQNFVRIVGKWQCAIRQSWQAQYDMEKIFSAPLPAGELTYSFYWRNSDWPNESRNHLYFKDASGQIVAGIQPSIRTRHLYFNSSATTSIPAMPDDGEWHMITAAYSLNGLALYVDGLQSAFFSGDYAVAGQIASMEMKGENFPIDIDEMAIWSRALSADEIAGIYNSNSPIDPYNPPVQPGAAQIIHRWSFEEGAGNAATDSIGGTILNHNASWVAGKFGSGMQHSSGIDNIISQSISPEIASRDLSIDFWWKDVSFPNDGREIVILKNNAGENIFGIRISNINIGPGDWHGRYYLNGEESAIGDIVPADGDWHHAAMVYDSYNFYMYIYIDGEEKIQIPHIWLDEPIQEISIYAENFPCQIDELEIWQGALTAEQVLEIYQK